MSKLLDAIKAHQTNTRFPLSSPILGLTTSSEHTPLGRAYNFKATIGAKVDVSDPEVSYAGNSSQVLDQILWSVRHQVAHEVFGEFREPLLKLRINALKAGDRESAQLVEGILDGMFKV